MCFWLFSCLRARVTRIYNTQTESKRHRTIVPIPNLIMVSETQRSHLNPRTSSDLTLSAILSLLCCKSWNGTGMISWNEFYVLQIVSSVNDHVCCTCNCSFCAKINGTSCLYMLAYWRRQVSANGCPHSSVKARRAAGPRWRRHYQAAKRSLWTWLSRATAIIQCLW